MRYPSSTPFAPCSWRRIRGGRVPRAGSVTFARAEDSALEDPVVAELDAAASRSCHRVTPAEYVGTLRRLADALMVEFSSEKAAHPLGLFGVWKIVDEVMRLIVDGDGKRLLPHAPVRHTAGDSLAQMQVEPGHDLEVAKADLADFFHTCDAVNRLLPLFRTSPGVGGRLRPRWTCRRMLSMRRVSRILGSPRCPWGSGRRLA